MKVIVVIAAAVGVSFYLIAMYACLVVASQMDEMDLYRRKREEHDGDNGDEEKSGQTGSADDREASGKTI